MPRKMRVSASLGTLANPSPYTAYNPSQHGPPVHVPMVGAAGGSGFAHAKRLGSGGPSGGLGSGAAHHSASGLGMGQLHQGAGGSRANELRSTDAALLESKLAQGLQALVDAERSAAIGESSEIHGKRRLHLFRVLFERVIERDAAFGVLLRRVKDE